MSPDLDSEHLALLLAERPFRAYPALLSTESDAAAWARSGAPSGAVVVADYQASPRGRGGLPWTVQPGRGLGFSLVTHPDLPAEREGWPYVAASLAVAEALGDTRLDWPDTVLGTTDLGPLAQLGVYADPGSDGVAWATVTVLVGAAMPPRGPLLAVLLDRIEERLLDDPDRVLESFRGRCVTLGRQVRARLIPMGPSGPEVVGEAVDVLADGALVIRTERGSRVAVPPQNLGLLEDPAASPEVPADIRTHLER